MNNDTDIDFDAAGAIQNAIEAAGGTVREFRMEEVQRQQGIMQGLVAMVGGGKERRCIFEVAIDGPTSRDIDVDDATADPGDALKALTVAHHVADQEGLDALAADIEDVYQRLGDVTKGDAHPADEMTAFGQGDQPGDADD